MEVLFMNQLTITQRLSIPLNKIMFLDKELANLFDKPRDEEMKEVKII